jgi:hypothetical protein
MRCAAGSRGAAGSCASSRRPDAAGRYTRYARLRNVGVGGGTGTRAIAARLTHYRTLFLGRCVAYRAALNGTVTLTY